MEESPFDNPHDNKNSLHNFIVEYSKIESVQEKLWDTVVKYNELLKPPFSEVELRSIVDAFYLEKNGFKPALSFSELMSQEFPKARYAIEPFFESGTMNMVSAPPNTWKSWLLFFFAANIAQGTSVLDKFPTEKTKVMIVNEEDSYRAVQDRFNILGITDQNLEMYFRIAQGSKLEVKFIDSLIKELKANQIGVVMFDSLRSMHSLNENDSTEMQSVLDLLKKISREGITVIFTHHHRKKGLMEKKGTAESSRGSTAINAAISGHISLEEEEREGELSLVVAHLKSKAGEKLPPFEIKIERNEGSIRFSYEGEFQSKNKKLIQTKDEVIAVLKDKNWKSLKQIMEEVDAGRDMIRQALTVLKAEGAIVFITRKEAIKKLIPVPDKGKANELVYSLNNEEAEMEMIQEELIADDAFNNF